MPCRRWRTARRRCSPILVLAGSARLKLSLPIAAAILALMVAVGLGYRQVIRAYPQGGGSYKVASENLGSLAGLLAGAGLILDYILTVTVSIAAGVAAVTSAVPSLASATVPIGVAVIAILVAGNLRGVRAAGSVFAGPTYLFVIAIALIVVVGLVKFAHGAWLVVVLIPLIVWACRKIHAHYERTHEALIAFRGGPHDGSARAAAALAMKSPPPPDGHGPERATNPGDVSNLVVVPIAAIDASSLHALAYAASLAQPVLAVHISGDEDEAARFHRYWQAWGDHLPLEVIVSPYRSTVAPLANYIEALHYQQPEVTLTVVVPEIVFAKRWQRALHRHIGPHLRRALRPHSGIAITSVPFHLP